MTKKIHKYIFFLLIFLIPINLGKHFVFTWSYVSGLLVDYFVPTIYLQDILILTLLFFSLFALDRSSIQRLKNLLNTKIPIYVIGFILGVFLSVLVSDNVFSSAYSFIRFVLYFMFFIYVLMFFEDTDFTPVVKVLSISVLLVGMLGIMQWLKQESVFNNYLWFGEQPYSFSTYGIVRENIFGKTAIPAYGTFRHPNIFGGFLALVLIWLFVLVPESRLTTFAFVIGVISLLTTVSIVSLIAFLLGALFLFLPRSTSVLITIFIVMFSLSLFLFESNNPSVYRRADLLNSGFHQISEFPLFGSGLNTSPLFAVEPRFMQPVHNIFVLIFAESGIFSFMFFTLLLVSLLLKTSLVKSNKIFFVSILQIIILGSFDHYLYTIHQTFLFLWLILGIAGYYSFKERYLPTPA